MNTEDNIESLDDTFISEEPVTNPEITETIPEENIPNSEENIVNSEEIVDNPENVVSDVAPEPISVNDMINNVGPTDLQNTNIDGFGQTDMNIDNINQNPNPYTLQDIGGTTEFNNIGVVPPTSNEVEKPKKKNNKVIIILLAIVLVGAIGYGVYYYLHMGNGGNKLKLKSITVSINSTISTNINDYILSGKPDSSCTSDFNDVLVNKAGTYDYKIICNSGTYKGQITVVDEDSPKVVIKNVVLKVGESVKAEDFIESCSDGSTSCTYTFEDQAKVDEYIKQVGTHEVGIKVQEADTDKTKVVKAYLIVIDKEITHNIVCTSDTISGDTHSYTIKDTLGIYNNGSGFVFAEVATRDYIIAYSSNENYETDKASIDSNGNLKLDIAEGKATFDSEKLTITITKILTINDLKAEFSNFSNSYVDIRNIYNNDSRGFECITNSVK